MRKGGGFGLVVLVIVMAVVLLLVARSWKSVAPTATQLPDGPSAPLETNGEDQAGEALSSGNLPDLNEMRSETDAHAERLQQALSEIE